MFVDLLEEISQDAEFSRDFVKFGSELFLISKEVINGDVRKVIIINMCILILKKQVLEIKEKNLKNMRI